MKTAKAVGIAAAACVPALAIAGLEGLHEFSAGQPIAAATMNENFAVLKAAHEELLQEVQALRAEQNARAITRDTQYAVADCEALRSTLLGLEAVTITSNATVTLTLPAGNHVCTGTIGVEHPMSRRLRIVGAGEDTTTLAFPAGNGFGFLVGLGLLADLTVSGSGTGAGINAYSLRSRVERVTSTGFDAGFQADYGRLELVGAVANSNKDGFRAINGGVLQCSSGCVASNNENGFIAVNAGRMFLTVPTAENNSSSGFQALIGSFLVASGASVGGTPKAFYAHRSSVIEARGGAKVIGPAVDTGFLAGFNSSIDARGNAEVTQATVGASAVESDSRIYFGGAWSFEDNGTDFSPPPSATPGVPPVIY